VDVHHCVIRMFSCLTQHTPCLKVDFTIFTRVQANPACAVIGIFYCTSTVPRRTCILHYNNNYTQVISLPSIYWSLHLYPTSIVFTLSSSMLPPRTALLFATPSNIPNNCFDQTPTEPDRLRPTHTRLKATTSPQLCLQLRHKIPWLWH
jgi:hypothetical protein